MAVLSVESRPGTAADAVAGLVPTEVVRPRDVAEVTEALRTAAERGLSVVPVGSGSKTGWAARPTACDLVVDTTGLDRVVEHTPGDLVVIAEAGVRLEALQAQLAAASQMLALDPAEARTLLDSIDHTTATMLLGSKRTRYLVPTRPVRRPR